jgi:small subunit ribosomal protein S4
MTGENLLRLLESRLDNIIYRLGWASSRPQARQMVVHSHFAVNGRKVNIPSFLVKDGDVVSVRDNRRDKESVKAIIEANASRPIPKWIDLDREKLEAKILSLPSREEIDAPVEEQLIVEFYSK